MVTVRAARDADAPAWLELRRELWPDGSEAEHREEIEAFFAGTLPRQTWAVLFAEDERGRLLGLAELSIRPYAEGCRSNRVAYLEGWFVRSDARGQGIGKALITAAEEWARSMGCVELASDADPDNDLSRSAHRGAGFAEVGLVRCFRKDL